MKKIPSSSLFKNQKHALDAPSPRGNNYLETSSNSNINNNLIAAKTKQNNYHNRNNHKSSLNNLS